MALDRGRRVGAYEVATLVGVGGMGEVYRARDTRIGRHVALKVVGEPFAIDADRIARLEREAQVLGSLNHPNIAQIYGFEESDGCRALVLEFVDGPTLADRIARGAIVLDDAIAIARQIVDALEAAHDQGIVHRDLKPANIKLRADGTVKVLDFGLAKVREATSPSSGERAGLTGSPTITTPALMTGVGMLLGTAAYMAPEQAKGRPADARSDVWAFGCVLYEMLTGARASAGDEVAETLALVITKEPDWTALPASTPAPIRTLLRRCLQKDPRRRLAHIADARLELDDAIASPTVTGPTPVTRSRRTTLAAWAGAAAAIVVAGAVVAQYARRLPDDRPVMRFTVAPPEGWTLASGLNQYGAASGPLAVSPDGRMIALLARNPEGHVRLWLRSLDARSAREVPDSDGATGPFWSPDSRFLGFFADGKLKKVAVGGGPAVTLCSSPTFNSATWGTSGVILMASAGATSGPILRVPAGGGAPSPATTLSPGDTFHLRPVFLPDGRHFFYRAAANGGLGPIYLASLDSPRRSVALQTPGASNVVYSNGNLLFIRDGTLMAQPFNLRRLALEGEPAPIAEQVLVISNYGVFSASDSGVLAYAPAASAGPSGLRLTWFDRGGRSVGSIEKSDGYGDISLAPDGKKAAVSVRGANTVYRDIWILDLDRQRPTRFTFDPGQEFEAVWSPDGKRVVFNSSRKGHFDLYVRDAAGAGAEEELLIDATDKHPSSWSPDGNYLLYSTGDTAADLWVLPLGGDRKPFPFLRSAVAESDGRFSPDGRWIAYVANDADGTHVYVAAFPASGAKYQASAQAGIDPRWRRDGKELFYLAPGNMLTAVAVSTQGDNLVLGEERPLFRLPISGARSRYDVAPDGRFLAAAIPDDMNGSQAAEVIVNWPALASR
jgi:Tol biopolymer transport system component